MWGLAQLAQRARADRGPGSPQLYESQVREALYGRSEKQPSTTDSGASPEHADADGDGAWEDPDEA